MGRLSGSVRVASGSEVGRALAAGGGRLLDADVRRGTITVSITSMGWQ
jgi:hypothetical protein